MSSLNGIGVGIPYTTYKGTGSITDSSTFYAPLETSLVLQRGTGDPTWSRATKAWGFNELGYLEELASGCAFFGGARLVRNLLAATEDSSSGSWVKSTGTTAAQATDSGGGSTAMRFTYGSSQSYLMRQSPTVTSRDAMYCAQFRFKTDATHDWWRLMIFDGGGNQCRVWFNAQTGTIGNTVPSGSGVFVSATLTDVGGGWFALRLVGSPGVAGTGVVYAQFSANDGDGSTSISSAASGDAITIEKPSLVDVTNYDASYVPEYVSVGVASSYFGAGIDGAKYFNTSWNGSPLTCLGFRREAAATNNLLQSRNLTAHNAGSITTKRWQSVTPVGAEILLNSSFDSGLTNWTTTIGSGGSISVTGGQCTFVSDGGTATYMTNAAVLTVGSTYVLEIIATGTGSVKLVNGAQEITGFGAGTNTISFVATSAVFQIYRTTGVACNLVLDSISVKLSSVQCAQTATGLDGIANTATTLTATAADAIILQPITLASADRCASAYVKRRTGTGSISFTQDGGSTWTDITSQINSSTWSRVEITATLANPSVGFKISTSGDAIDVDCVQNEAGAVATSPIVTTTAAVTRNADSLTYQTAGNIDLAVGTMFCELFSPAMSAFPPVLLIGTGSCSLITGEPTSWRFNDSTTTVTIASGLSSIKTGKRKRAASWGGATKSVCGDGIAPTSGAFDGSFGNGATIDIGNTLNGYIGPVAIYNYQMTDAQLQAITS